MSAGRAGTWNPEDRQGVEMKGLKGQQGRKNLVMDTRDGLGQQFSYRAIFFGASWCKLVQLGASKCKWIGWSCSLSGSSEGAFGLLELAEHEAEFAFHTANGVGGGAAFVDE